MHLMLCTFTNTLTDSWTWKLRGGTRHTIVDIAETPQHRHTLLPGKIFDCNSAAEKLVAVCVSPTGETEQSTMILKGQLERHNTEKRYNAPKLTHLCINGHAN